MLVVDASVAVELLIAPTLGHELGAALVSEDLAAPQLLAVEVLSVLRRSVRHGALSAQRARGALEDLDDLGIVWMDIPPLLGSAWQLRDSLSAYDAVYVALADALGTRVITLDAGIVAAAPGFAVDARAWLAT